LAKIELMCLATALSLTTSAVAMPLTGWTR